MATVLKPDTCAKAKLGKQRGEITVLGGPYLNDRTEWQVFADNWGDFALAASGCCSADASSTRRSTLPHRRLM
jgi:hypothetical protein